MENKISIGDLLAKEIPEQEQFLGTLLYSGILCMLYALPGLGKTYFALWLAAAVAGGGWFLKWKAPKPRKVLYIDSELGLRLLKKRSFQLAESLDFDLDESAIEFCSLDQFPGGALPALNNAENHAIYDELGRNCDVFIIDNYCTATQRYGRQTDEQVWEGVRPWLLRLRAAGKAVLIIHHAGKSGAQLGTSLKEQPMDWIIQLRNASNISMEDGVKMWLTFDKNNRNFEISESAELFIRFFQDGEAIRWQWATAQDERKRLVRYFMNRDMTTYDMAQVLGIDVLRVKLLKKDIENETQRQSSCCQDWQGGTAESSEGVVRERPGAAQISFTPKIRGGKDEVPRSYRRRKASSQSSGESYDF